MSSTAAQGWFEKPWWSINLVKVWQGAKQVAELTIMTAEGRWCQESPSMPPKLLVTSAPLDTNKKVNFTLIALEYGNECISIQNNGERLRDKFSHQWNRSDPLTPGDQS